MVKGRITNINEEKGFGFIALDDKSGDAHFRVSDVGGLIQRGDEIECEIKKSSDGRLSAFNISVKAPMADYVESLNKGYFSEDGILAEDMIIKWPQYLAKKFGEAKPSITYSQLRKFYDKIMRYQRQIEIKHNFAEVKADLLLLSPLVAEAVGKNKVPKEFQVFIDTNLQQAKLSENHFVKGFAFHYQSVIGYFKYYYPSSK